MNSPAFIKQEGPLTCSQGPVTGPQTKPREFCSLPHNACAHCTHNAHKSCAYRQTPVEAADTLASTNNLVITLPELAEAKQTPRGTILERPSDSLLAPARNEGNHNRICNNPPLDHIMSEMNAIHSLKPCYF